MYSKMVLKNTDINIKQVKFSENKNVAENKIIKVIDFEKDNNDDNSKKIKIKTF